MFSAQTQLRNILYFYKKVILDFFFQKGLGEVFLEYVSNRDLIDIFSITRKLRFGKNQASD